MRFLYVSDIVRHRTFYPFTMLWVLPKLIVFALICIDIIMYIISYFTNLRYIYLVTYIICSDDLNQRFMFYLYIIPNLPYCSCNEVARSPTLKTHTIAPK